MTLTATQREPGGRDLTRPRVRVQRFSWAVVAYNVLVIVWGAMVRATGSGAGCGNHWPLCNGQVIPISPGVHTVIEFVHRAMTGGSTLTMLLLLVWTFRATAKQHAARVAVVLSTLLLLNEAFLGALLVKLGYVTGNQSMGRVVLLSIHLSNTLLLLGAVTVTAVLLGTVLSRRDLVHRLRASGRQPLLLAGISLGATLLVGVSGSLAALGDTLFPSASLRSALTADLSSSAPALIRVRWVHPAAALAATVCLMLLLRLGWSRQTTAKPARWVTALLVAQFLLGIADVLLLAPVWLQLLHLLGADLFWVALVVLSSRFALSEQAEPPILAPANQESQPALAR